MVRKSDSFTSKCCHFRHDYSFDGQERYLCYLGERADIQLCILYITSETVIPYQDPAFIIFFFRVALY